MPIAARRFASSRLGEVFLDVVAREKTTKQVFCFPAREQLLEHARPRLLVHPHLSGNGECALGFLRNFLWKEALGSITEHDLVVVRSDLVFRGNRHRKVEQPAVDERRADVHLVSARNRIQVRQKIALCRVGQIERLHLLETVAETFEIALRLFQTACLHTGVGGLPVIDLG